MNNALVLKILACVDIRELKLLSTIAFILLHVLTSDHQQLIELLQDLDLEDGGQPRDVGQRVLYDV